MSAPRAPQAPLEVTDLFDVAVLAGGPGRAVDAALVVLVETGRVVLDGEGRLRAVEAVARRGADHPVLTAVLETVGGDARWSVPTVRARAVLDRRVAGVAGALQRRGLLRAAGPVGRLLRSGTTAPTATGRAVLRAAAAAPEGLTGAGGTGGTGGTGAAGTSAALVALHGPDRTTDAPLRAELVELPSWSRGLRARSAGTRGAAATAGMQPAVLGGWHLGGGAGAVGGGDGGSSGGDGGGSSS